jgi:hypothetical protein
MVPICGGLTPHTEHMFMSRQQPPDLKNAMIFPDMTASR